MASPPAPTEQVNARLFVIGAVVSSAGSTAMMLVAGIWVLELTRSASLAALVGVCIWVPTAAGPLLGPFVDRWRRQPLLVTGNLVLGATLLLLLLVPDVVGIWLLFAVMLVYGVGFVLLDAAEAALLPAAIGRQSLGRVNGQRMAGQEGMKLLAPAVGAGLFAVAGAHAVMALDAATFAAAAVAIRALRVHERAPARMAGDWRAETVQGVSHLWRQRHLRRVVLTGSLAMFLTGLNGAAVYALVEAMGRTPEVVGLLAAAQGLGSVGAGLTVGRILDRFGPSPAAAAGLMVLGTGVALRATAEFSLTMVGSILVGAGLPLVLVTAFTVLQRATSDEVVGRVMATASTAIYTPVPVAIVIGAAAVAVLDVRLLLAGAAATALWLGVVTTRLEVTDGR